MAKRTKISSVEGIDVSLSRVGEQNESMVSGDDKEGKKHEPTPELLYMAKVVGRERIRLGLSKHALAAKARMNVGTIILFDSGAHNMGILNIMRLANSVGLQLEDLIPRTSLGPQSKRQLATALDDVSQELTEKAREMARRAGELRAEADDGE